MSYIKFTTKTGDVYYLAESVIAWGTASGIDDDINSWVTIDYLDDNIYVKETTENIKKMLLAGRFINENRS